MIGERNEGEEREMEETRITKIGIVCAGKL